MRLADKILSKQSGDIQSNIEATIAILTQLITNRSKIGGYQELLVEVKADLANRILKEWAESEGFQVSHILNALVSGLLIAWGRTSPIFSSFDCSVYSDGKIKVHNKSLLEAES